MKRNSKINYELKETYILFYFYIHKKNNFKKRGNIYFKYSLNFVFIKILIFI